MTASIEFIGAELGLGRCVLFSIAHLRLGAGAYGISGPNGCGKSTLLRCLCGLQRLDRGRVLVGGVDLGKRPRKAKALLSYVPDTAEFYEHLSVEHAVRLILALKGRSDASADAFASRDPFGIAEQRRQSFGSLSLGWRKKVLLHAALCSDTEVLLLDEPTVGLDAASATILADQLRARSAEGWLTLFSTHDRGFASAVAAVDVSSRIWAPVRGAPLNCKQIALHRDEVTDEGSAYPDIGRPTA